MSRVEEIAQQQRRIKQTMRHIKFSLDSIRWNYEALFETYMHYKKEYQTLEYERMNVAKLVKCVHVTPRPAKKTPEEMTLEELEEFIAKMQQLVEEKTPQ